MQGSYDGLGAVSEARTGKACKAAHDLSENALVPKASCFIVTDLSHNMADDTQLAEATQALSFAEFLERMKDPQAANLVRSIKKYVWLVKCQAHGLRSSMPYVEAIGHHTIH